MSIIEQTSRFVMENKMPIMIAIAAIAAIVISIALKKKEKEISAEEWSKKVEDTAHSFRERFLLRKIQVTAALPTKARNPDGTESDDDIHIVVMKNILSFSGKKEEFSEVIYCSEEGYQHLKKEIVNLKVFVLLKIEIVGRLV